MDNKLNELSKPVAWTDERGNLCTNRNKERGLESRYHQDYEKYTTPFYSQEYVSALLAELEFEKQNNAGVAGMVEDYETKLAEKDKRIAELERSNQAQDDHINQQQDRIDSLEKKNGDLGRSLGAAEKRLATPVRLPDTRQSVSGERYQWSDGVFNYKQDAIAMLRAAGFTVEGDE